MIFSWKRQWWCSFLSKSLIHTITNYIFYFNLLVSDWLLSCDVTHDVWVIRRMPLVGEWLLCLILLDILLVLYADIVIVSFQIVNIQQSVRLMRYLSAFRRPTRKESCGVLLLTEVTRMSAPVASFTVVLFWCMCHYMIIYNNRLFRRSEWECENVRTNVNLQMGRNPFLACLNANACLLVCVHWFQG